MVIKIWYSAGKSIEPQDWMVICSNGTWEEHFYFCFIVFVSICLTQVFINSLLTIKVSMLKKKKYFPPSHFGRKIHIPLIFLGKHLGHCPLCGLFTLLCYLVSLWIGCVEVLFYNADPWPHTHSAQQLLPCLIWVDLIPYEDTETHCTETHP